MHWQQIKHTGHCSLPSQCSKQVVHLLADKAGRADLLKVWLGMKLEKADRNDGKGSQGKVELESSVDAVLGY